MLKGHILYPTMYFVNISLVSLSLIMFIINTTDSKVTGSGICDDISGFNQTGETSSRCRSVL